MDDRTLYGWGFLALALVLWQRNRGPARVRPRARPERPQDSGLSGFFDYFRREVETVTGEDIDAPPELGSASDWLDQFKGGGTNV